MKKKEENEEILDEYDFTQGEKGRYFSRFKEGSNVVILDPDVAEVFKDQRVVNESLRALGRIIKLNETM
ncbi:unnamed protein product [marine sediment metagenome]|uniref:Uncharacterized protein n=1 Tax=marine sediment metagenome TaxID=412755 RepID=X1V6M0_9ZZZZ